MSKPLHVLIVEDSENDSLLLVNELRRGGYEPVVERVETPETMTAALGRKSWEIVFCDYTMPRFTGVAALKILRERDQDLPFIFVSGTIGEDTAVEAMKAGANDYIMKGNLKRLIPAVQRELREAEMRRSHAKAEEIIQHMAFHDTLTDLPNRNMLYDRLLNAIRTGSDAGKPMALLLIDLGHNLGLQVVAEGVENKETYDRLVEMGCDAAQGYYMCRPAPSAELTRWLSESPWGLSESA